MYFGEFHGEVTVTWPADDPRAMILVDRVIYIDRHGERWFAMSGLAINGASVPWFFRRLFPAYIGRYRRATVIHDAACVGRFVPSWRVHRMFYEAMRCDGAHPAVAWLMWAAVRVFGPRFPGEEGRVSDEL